MLHTFVALVDDQPGVLSRITSLFRRLNVNIVSLTVGNSETAGVSRLTLVSDAAGDRAHRIIASLYKLIGVREVDDVGRESAVVRELALLKVAAGPEARSDLFQLAEVFRARVVDLAPDSLMLEITGSASKIEGLVQILLQGNYRVLEMARTGRMAMRRGLHTSRVTDALNDTASENPKAPWPANFNLEAISTEKNEPEKDKPEKEKHGENVSR